MPESRAGTTFHKILIGWTQAVYTGVGWLRHAAQDFKGFQLPMAPPETNVECQNGSEQHPSASFIDRVVIGPLATRRSQGVKDSRLSFVPDRTALGRASLTAYFLMPELIPEDLAAIGGFSTERSVGCRIGRKARPNGPCLSLQQRALGGAC